MYAHVYVHMHDFYKKEGVCGCYLYHPEHLGAVKVEFCRWSCKEAQFHLCPQCYLYCPAVLARCPFLRLSATVMSYFFAVKFNHVIQVLLLVFLTNHPGIQGRRMTAAIRDTDGERNR